jgi:hypothetical protein
LLVSEETFHQKLTVPGPVTFVRRALESSSPAALLRAASTPSCVTVACPTHGAESLVVQTQSGVSKASASGRTGVTVSRALELVTLPTALLTTTV